MDRAILRHDHPDLQPYFKLDEMPFDFERRRSSVVVDKHGEAILISKGAPEHLFKICSQYLKDGQVQPMDQTMQAEFTTFFNKMSADRYRLLAVAYRKVASQSVFKATDEIDLTLAGFLIFTDPPLEDAAEVIDALNKEGVQVKIITGDNELVAQNICRGVGIFPEKIVLCQEIEHMTDPALAKIAEETLLFARQKSL